MNRELLDRAIVCKPCTAMGTILKSIIPSKQYQAYKPCIGSNQEIQIDFARPVNKEKDLEIFILTCLPLYSPIPPL